MEIRTKWISLCRGMEKGVLCECPKVDPCSLLPLGSDRYAKSGCIPRDLTRNNTLHHRFEACSLLLLTKATSYRNENDKLS